MDSKRIMSLQFFAKRIEVSVNRLSWCISQTENQNWERNAFPAVKIKNSALYYDFLKDTLDEIINSGGMKTVVKDAKVTETPKGYRFEANGAMIEFSSEDVERVFENKIYSEELNRKAQRFA